MYSIIITASKNVPRDIYDIAEYAEKCVNRAVDFSDLSSQKYNGIVSNIVFIDPAIGSIPDEVKIIRSHKELWSTVNMPFRETLLKDREFLTSVVYGGALHSMERIPDNAIPDSIRDKIIGSLRRECGGAF